MAARILVVDDSPTARTLVRTILAHAEFQILEAESGEKALALLERETPDLIISDVMMPGMDGYELVRRMRKNRRLSGIPILMLTAKAELVDKVAAFEAGADDYVVKTVGPAELELRVEALLARSAPSTARRASARMGRTVAVFGCKGGVGTTTIAVNLAVALRAMKDEEVALVDADFSFGDIGLHLNLPPVHSINDLVPYAADLEDGLLTQVMLEHSSKLKVLLGPPRPERADEISTRLVSSVLEIAARNFDYIVVDTQRVYDDRMLMVLDRADRILMVLTADIGALRNASLFLTLAKTLGYPTDKVLPVLNGAGVEMGIRLSDVKRVLGGREPFIVESGGTEVALATNRGEPVFVSNPRNKVARAMRRLAETLAK